MTRGEASPERGVRKLFPLLAMLIPFAGLALIDLALRVCGVLPPEDPLLFYIRSYGQNFSPLVEAEPGVLTIRSDWLNTGRVNRIIEGERVGQRFIYPGFRQSRVELDKPEDEQRIFVLGGSSVFGLYLRARDAFPSVLETELSGITPEVSINVVNLGCPGWASNRVANVVDSIVDLDPDLIIIYSGHNEMLKGKIDASATLDSLGQMRAALLERSSLFAWSNHFASEVLWSRENQKIRAEAAALEAGNILLYQPASTPPEERSAFLAAAEPHYRTNLEAIVDLARARGVNLLFALSAANFFVPPKAAEHASAAFDATEFDLIMESGLNSAQREDWQAALGAFERCVELSPEHALAHYQLGRAMMKLGRDGDARHALQRALDLDRWTHRITSRLENVFISVAQEREVPLVDFRPHFEQRQSLDEAEYERFFLDHVHPTSYGHAEIARMLAPEVASILKLTPGDQPDGARR